MKKKLLAVLLTLCLVLGLFPMGVLAAPETTENLTPGAVTSQDGLVTVQKTASKVSGLDATYDVTLTVTTTDQVEVQPQTPAHVVLVIDASGSMKGDRLVKTKAAAKEFAGIVLGEDAADDNQVAVVTYSDHGELKQGFTKNVNQINTAIDGIRANGGTNIQSGLYFAEEAIRNDNDASNAKKVILLFSDGYPTYCYELIGTASGECNGSGTFGGLTASVNADSIQITGRNVKNVIGAGSDDEVTGEWWDIFDLLASNLSLSATCTADYLGHDLTWGKNHTFPKGVKYNYETKALVNKADTSSATLWEGDQAKVLADVYTVLLKPTNSGEAEKAEGLMQKLATGGNYHTAENAEDLAKLFKGIADDVVKEINAGKVSDPMAQFVMLDEETFSDPDAVEFNANGFTWDVSESTPSNEGDRKTYTLTYRVSLDTDNAGFETGVHPLNGTTTFTYSVDGKEKNVTFNVPTVYEKAVRYQVKYSWNQEDAPKDAVLPDTVSELADGAEYIVDGKYTKDTIIEIKDDKGNVTGKYTFSGWKLDDKVVTGTQEINAKNVELKGTWNYKEVTPVEKKIEVNVNCGNGTWEDGTTQPKYITLSSLTPNKTEALPAVVAPDADKEFDKWTNNLDSSTLSENASISYNQMAAIIGEFEEIGYIGWTAQYKDIPAPAMVTFTYMAGENGSLKGAVSEEVPVFGPKGAFPFNVPTPVANEGYKFAGWQIGESPVGEVTLLSSEELKTMPFAQNTTFVAVFEEDPDAGKTLKIYWGIDNPDAASWKLFNNSNAWTETIAWSDRDNSFVMPEVVVEEGYHLAGWSVSGTQDNYWDANTYEFGLTGLIVEDDKGGYVSITANIVSDEPEDPNAGKTLKIYWGIDNPDAASWKLFNNSNAWTETIAWSDRDNSFVMPEVVVEEGYHLAGWSVSGTQDNYWDANTYEFGLTGLIVEDDKGGYVSITANIVSDEPEDPNAGKTLKIYWGIDNPDAANWKLFNNSSWTETIAWSDRSNTFVMPEVIVKEGYHLAGWSVSGARGEYWDADTQTFDLDGLIVEGDEGGYVSITANIVKDVPATYTVTLVNEGRYAYGEGSYKAGETVTVYAGTKVGYSFDKWTSGDISITRPYSSKITFTMPAHDVVVKANWDRAGSVLPSLPDVPDDTTPNWLNLDDHDAYIQGYPDGFVKPQNNITRAEVATIFYRLLTDEAREYFWSNDSGFSDVKPGDWFNTAVSTMVNAGVITGYNDGTFRPNDPITRAEFATIAARFLSDPYSLQDQFYDTEGHWAEVYINRAAEVGWINGYNDGSFRPNKAITRAEAVTLVNNVLGREPHADYMLDDMITWPDNPKSAWYYEDIQEATNSHDYRWSSGKRYEIWTSLN